MSRVIHVDNSNFFRKIVGVFVSGFDLEFEGFSRGDEALRSFKNGGVSCVITGLELVDMSGEEFIKKIISFSSSQPIIVLSSHSEDDTAMRLKKLGVKAIIQKSSNWKTELAGYLK